AFQFRVPRAIDLTHASRAEKRKNLVVPDAPSDPGFGPGLYQSLCGGLHRRFFHKTSRTLLLGKEGFHIAPKIGAPAACFIEKRAAPRPCQLSSTFVEVLNVFEAFRRHCRGCYLSYS